VTSVQVLQWHNPRASQIEKLIPFRIAIVLEHMKSVSYLPLSPIQKMACMPVACLTPLARNAWVWFLRKTGPLRLKLRTITGWKRVRPSHVTG
jgi:hypothetical protein